MPLQAPEHFGTEGDGSASLEYCCYCYKDGSFTADCTMDEMIGHCLQFLNEFNADQGTRLTREQAAAEMKKFFPMLKRWAVAGVKAGAEGVLIRKATAADFDAVMDVEKSAFGYDKEARLVAGLLDDQTAEPMVSLLAFLDGEAVGHVLFTKAVFEGCEDSPMMHILAPLAVKPGFQRQGIGGLLIEEGLRLLQECGSGLVFVLGHKEYYPRYGFTPCAARLGYAAPYTIPEEYEACWMVLPLGKSGFGAGRGQVKCCDVLNRHEHWRDDEADR